MRRVRASFTVIFISAATAIPVQGAQTDMVTPNFSPDSATGWLKPPGDEFIQPESGPGPVKADPGHPYVSNAIADQETVKIADLSNPISAALGDRENAQRERGGFGRQNRLHRTFALLATRRAGFLLYPVHPIIFIQTAKEVLMTWGQDFQLRHVYLNVPHSENLKPSWYGESVGHYENGDTLVVDTIGLNDRTYVDNYRTPHTTQLHVVERFRLVNSGAAMEVRVRVEDPGAFTTPWNAVQRYKIDHRPGEVPLHEMVCAENNTDHFNQGLVPIPQTNKPDF